jgi:hypothetical protein
VHLLVSELYRYWNARCNDKNYLLFYLNVILTQIQPPYIGRHTIIVWINNYESISYKNATNFTILVDWNVSTMYISIHGDVLRCWSISSYYYHIICCILKLNTSVSVKQCTCLIKPCSILNINSSDYEYEQQEGKWTSVIQFLTNRIYCCELQTFGSCIDLQRTRHRWDDIIKMHFKERRWECVAWTQVA